jgi:ABC-type branched-subunit amino acid transport system substrate-binding protein
MRNLKFLRVLALFAGLALILTACPQEDDQEQPDVSDSPTPGDEDGEEPTGATVEATGLGIYGADGLADEGLADSVDPDNPNALDGFKGTVPDRQVQPGYGDRLKEFTGDEEIGLTFAPQAYDCATLIGLGAVAADSFHGGAIAAEMPALTRGDNECDSFEECAQLLEEGETIDYQAASGLGEWTDWGDPASGTYELWGWEDGEFSTLESGIELEMAEATEEPDFETPEVPDDPPPPEDTFRMGYLLPETGDLAFLGPPQIESVRMAVQDMNDAGGVAGAPV